MIFCFIWTFYKYICVLYIYYIYIYIYHMNIIDIIYIYIYTYIYILSISSWQLLRLINVFVFIQSPRLLVFYMDSLENMAILDCALTYLLLWQVYEMFKKLYWCFSKLCFALALFSVETTIWFERSTLFRFYGSVNFF